MKCSITFSGNTLLIFVITAFLLLPTSTFATTAQFTYERTPVGTTISVPLNTLTFHIAGTFGVDFCDSNSSGYTINVHRAQNSQGVNDPYDYYTDGNFIPQGATVDDILQIPVTPGNYDYVRILCGATLNDHTSSFYTEGTEGVSSTVFTVVPPPPTLTLPAQLPDATVGATYSTTFQVNGGAGGPYSARVSDDRFGVYFSNTEGIFLSRVGGNYSNTFKLSGIPQAAGDFTLTISGVDKDLMSTSTQVTLHVAPLPSSVVYSRTPSGNTVSAPIHLELHGTFGVDFCTNDSYRGYAWQLYADPFALPGHGTTYSSAVYQHAFGDVIDQDLPISPDLGAYNLVQIVCLGSGVPPFATPNRSFTIEGDPFDFSTPVFTVVPSAPNNRPPVIEPIGNQTVNEHQTLTFTVSASDPDGDALTYSAANLPPGATFDPATHVFTWTPNYGQAGNYTNVEFTVADSGTPMQLADQMITISVGHVNRPPVIVPLGEQQASTTVPTSFTVSASDPDGDTVILTAENLPTGATFNPSTGVFSWTPTYNQSGVYVITVVATDNGSPAIATSSMEVVISVSDSSPTTLTQDIIDTITSSDLPTNQQNSYLANLRKVTIFIDKGQITAAINQLNAFIQKLNQDYEQAQLTLEEYTNYLGQAQKIISDLE